jgi:CHAT domain-containing protein
MLPASRAEVDAIGHIYGSRATVLTGAAASEQAFRLRAPNAAIIHLATNGVLNKRNPLFSFVELAPGNGEDGRLEVREALGLAIHARLLVLSACQTALSSGALEDVPIGDDWVGLVQAFLVAGASNVMGTLWPVEDRATARLMELFYVALKSGQSEPDALAAAQRSALRDASTAHPFYWAGFSIVERRDVCTTGECAR